MQALKDFLARDLGGEQAQGHIGNLIFRIEPWARRHQPRQLLPEFCDAMAAQRRDHEGVREGERMALSLAASSRSFGGSTVSILLSTRILGGGDLRQPAEDGLDFGVDAFMGIDEQGGHIGVAGAAPGRSHHGPVEPAFRREDSRRIDKDDLGRAFESNPAHRAARCLNLAGNDRDFRSNERG